MAPDIWSLYALMAKSRAYEEAIADLWKEGLISGEMHLGTGEEAIHAGVLSQIQEGDALALDHRGTPPLIMRGVDPYLLLRELLGKPDGLCHGQGGHMHLYSKEHLLASSGIVGASGPAAVGFALSAQHLRPGSVAVAFFGEGALNQGMLMESFNLATAWKLPVLFVCKDDSWSITSESKRLTPGSVPQRIQGFGLPYLEVDGLDVAAVWKAAQEGLYRARNKGGPTFLHARCVHLEAHFLGYQLLRITRHPLREMPQIIFPLLKSFISLRGAPINERWQGLKVIFDSVYKTLRDPRQSPANDPLFRTRSQLPPESVRLSELEGAIQKEVMETVARARKEPVK